MSKKMTKKKLSIKLDPTQKNATRKRVGVNKDNKLDRSALSKDIAKQKKAVKNSRTGSARRKSAVKKLRQDMFAKNFAK